MTSTKQVAIGAHVEHKRESKNHGNPSAIRNDILVKEHSIEYTSCIERPYLLVEWKNCLLVEPVKAQQFERSSSNFK